MNNYWDWAWPYYADQFSGFFSFLSFSWAYQDTGGPLHYASGYYLNLFLSLMRIFKIDPEIIQIILLILVLIVTLYILFKTITSIVGHNHAQAVLLALLVLFNPAILYKLLAGHLNYLVSYVIFIYLLYLLFIKYRNKPINWLLVALLIGFIGIQIQFFIIALIFLIIFFSFNKQKINILKIMLLLIIVFFINLVWLSNFIIGANSINDLSGFAVRHAFSDLMFATYSRIIVMAYSPATLLQLIYTNWQFAFFGIFTLFVFFYCIKSYRSWNKNHKVIAISLAVFFILGTGFFHKINIPIISTLYPMYREVGHFAPLIFLFLVLFLIFTWPKNIWLQRGLNIYIILFIAINTYMFYQYLPRVDYKKAREAFNTFHEFNKTDDSIHRVLTYPFWNQYGFSFSENSVKYSDGRRLSNSGWDSFTIFSGKESVSHYMQNQELKNSLQYRLLRYFDITELENKNIKYIYDYSDIYESHFEEYVDPLVYDYDLSLIRNDPNFQDKLIKHNPNRIVRVTDKILELTNFKPRINGQNIVFQRLNPTQYTIRINNLSNKTDLEFLENYHKDWVIKAMPTNQDKSDIPEWCIDPQKKNKYHVIECFESEKFIVGNEWKLMFIPTIAKTSHMKVYDYAHSWEISKDEIIKLGEQYYQKNEDGSINIDIVLYFWPQTYFLISILISVVTIGTVVLILVYSKLRKKNEITK